MYSKKPKNIAYTNTGQDRDHNIYTEEFLGGADTFIYINGERYKDISAIQYSIREQVKPVYGYGSRVYDDIVSGVRIVQGILKIPVRNTENNESLTFVPTSESNEVATASMAPNWVYNYSPPISDNNNSSIVNEEIPNSKSKINIINYKKESGMEINSRSDFGLSTNTIIKNVIIEDTDLKYEPSEESTYSIGRIDKGTIIKIIASVNSYYLIEEVIYNKTGYIEKNKIEVL